MKGHIGEFEELVLLTIATLGDQAYGVAVLEDIQQRTQRKTSIGALHSTITRLDEKGFVTSYLGEPTNERGGRRKRFFQLTASAKQALFDMKTLRDELWELSDLKLYAQ
ncbi:helix-turn-helix transcriptional regulator [Reichenbachiella carrageenanivorans]|uniref:Helix-turn-helix transcriptional regulator n=1 Tax=Reichenbachiella carrageenanivorans TaxID=2979869 RepID=A0ABY6D9H1_9BACT|nr:helix-turn-helix transcriptional regulator [Reichenbachiella carrageenanivorans]UXX80525.1 helix-turn-helix transcriptional regulator [Reichenbachiella carrageenanivorans]